MSVVYEFTVAKMSSIASKYDSILIAMNTATVLVTATNDPLINANIARGLTGTDVCHLFSCMCYSNKCVV